MVTKVYAHILDEDRKINAQKFDEMFYGQEKRESRPSGGSKGSFQPEKDPAGVDAGQIMAMLTDNPELASEIRNLLTKTA
jgi:hypothetical protein